MKPVEFHGCTKTLQPNGKKYSDDVVAVKPLPIWTNGEQCVSCWRPNLRERLSVLIFGRVWLATLSGSTQCPALVAGQRDYFSRSANS
jgi:hypothetical protein